MPFRVSDLKRTIRSVLLSSQAKRRIRFRRDQHQVRTTTLQAEHQNHANSERMPSHEMGV